MLDLWNFGDRLGLLFLLPFSFLAIPEPEVGIACFVFWGETGEKVVQLFSLMRLKAEGEGKFESLQTLIAEELSLPTDRAELNPLELDVRLPRPGLEGLLYWYLMGPEVGVGS